MLGWKAGIRTRGGIPVESFGSEGPTGNGGKLLVDDVETELTLLVSSRTIVIDVGKTFRDQVSITITSVAPRTHVVCRRHGYSANITSGGSTQ